MKPRIDINRLGKAIEEIMNARLEKDGVKVTVTVERKEEAYHD